MGRRDAMPLLLTRSLAGRDTLQRVVKNSFWLFCEQGLRMAAGFLVGIWLARYLGPERYGWLCYALGIVGLASSFGSLGISPIVVRELARDPERAHDWLRSAFSLKAVGASLGFLVCVAVAWLGGVPAAEVKPLVVVAAIGMLFQVFDFIDLAFQARGEARISAWIRMGSCLLAAGLKVALILHGAPLVTFAAAGVVELALAASGWLWVARARKLLPGWWRFDFARVPALVRESLPLALSALAIYTQAYADQIVLGAMLGGDSLGQYAAATRVIAVFAFVPTIVHTVSAPEITRAKRDDEGLYWRRLHRLYRVMTALFIAFAVPLILFGPVITRALYGVAYTEAAQLLPWLALRLFFTNFGIARNIFITNESLFRFALGTAIAGAVVNIGLNFWLVPRAGVHGAVVASLVSFAVTTFALDWLHPGARANLRVMMRAVLLPWRSSLK